MKKYQILFLLSLFGLCGFIKPFTPYTYNHQTKFGTNYWLNKEIQILEEQTLKLNTNVLRLSLIAYINARKNGLNNKKILTIIDYSKPSNEKRLWVFDLNKNRILYNTWVSHGVNSGGQRPKFFSNQNGSRKSSIGVFLTETTYIGNEGYSLKLKGLEYGVNDNAYDRHIVIHGAWYVGREVIKKYGTLGRSFGCPAVNLKTVEPLIDTIKDNTLLFVYYPDRYWLNHSRYLALK